MHEWDASNGSDLYFHRAIRKYGWDAFEWTVLAEDDDEEWLFLVEKKYVNQLGTKSPGGYNLKDGGEGGSCPCEETRRRMSESAKNRPPMAEDVRQKKREFLLNAWQDPEFRKYMRKARIGHSVSEQAREKLRKANTGKKHTEETKKKVSKSREYYKASEETKEKIRLSMLEVWRKRKEPKK